MSYTLDLTSYYPGETTSGGYGYGGFDIDSNGVAWVLFYDGTLIKYDTISGTQTEIALGVEDAYCSGLAVEPSGNLLYFTNLETGNEQLYKYTTGTGILSALQTYKGNLAWFVCGDATQSSVPSTDSALLSACSLNGVKWAAPLADYNCFSSSDMETRALSTATADLCTSAIHDSVCDVVAELPPYICTKEEKDAFTTYLGVAAANAELLYAVLVFLCGLCLTTLAAMLRSPTPPSTSKLRAVWNTLRPV